MGYRFLLLGIWLLSGVAVAEGWSGTFHTAVTHTSNLEVQADTGITANTQSDLTRSGLEAGITFDHQSLGDTGGYGIDGGAYLNKGLAGRKTISDARLAAYRLSALSPNWLLRAGIDAEHYQNAGLPTNSYQRTGTETTLGYMGSAGKGVDITLSVEKEDHGQVADAPYSVDRKTIKWAQYLRHEKGRAYWSLHGTYQHNDADDDSRDYASRLLAVQYNQWHLGPFTGQTGIQWQQDAYKQVTGNLTGDRNRATREDAIYLATASLGKPLGRNLHVQLDASMGHDDATTLTGDKDFYSLAAGLRWDF